MRILVVGHTYVARANWAKWLALLRLDREVQILAVAPERWREPGYGAEQRSPAEVRDRFEFRPLPVYARGGRYLFAPGPIIAQLRAYQPDIVHVEEEPWSLPFLEVAAARR